MARFKARAVGLVTVLAFAIGIASLSVWQAREHTAQAAQEESTYTVQSGDSLRFIARELGVSVEELAAANGLPVNAPLVRGQVLTIPTGTNAASADSASDVSQAATDEPIEEAEATDEATEEPIEEATAEAEEEATTEAIEEAEAEEVAVAAAAPASTPVPTPKTYTVQAGDSLHSIARKVGVYVQALAAANGLKPNSPLVRGQKLILPIYVPAPAAAVLPPPAAPITSAVSEATPEATEAAAEEAEAEDADEEPTAAATEEATDEAAEEAEATDEASEEATPEATDEMTEEEATPEVAEEATDEADEESTEEEATEAAEATDEASEEATPESSEEATEEGSTASAEATEEASEEMTEEATPAATEEAAEEGGTSAEDEASPEATDEATEEATAVATEESTEEPTAEATEEPTATPTEEPTATPTEEATEEPTATPTEEPSDEGNILDSLTEQGNFTIFLSLLEAANLTQTLTSDDSFTVFAPVDEAFDALPAGTVDALLASSPDDLSQILLYHIVPGEIFAEDLSDGATIVTAQGGIVDVTVTPSGIEINGAKIITPDIETTNGVIHSIDTVLLPTDNVAAVPRGTAAPTTTEAASGDAASVIIVPTTNTDTAAAAQQWVEPDNSINLFSPVAAAGYHSPIEIIGLSNTFNGLVAVRLMGEDGTLLGQRFTLGGAESFDFFHTDVRFHVNEATPATLNVLEIDIAEGSILNSVDTPLILIPGQRFIDVNSPAVGQSVCDPILVSGYSNTFEANVVLTLSDTDGNVLSQIPTTGGSMGVYRDFATHLPYSVTEATPMLVGLSEIDASGTFPTIDETVIPVLLHSTGSSVCQ